MGVEDPIEDKSGFEEEKDPDCHGTETERKECIEISLGCSR